MSFDFANFKPESKEEFLEGLAEAVSTDFAEFWTNYKESSKGHLRSIVEGVTQTRIDLEAGLISKEVARSLNTIHQLAWRNYVLSVELLPNRIAQNAIDTVTKGVSWAFFNLTGVNIAPSIVRSG